MGRFGLAAFVSAAVVASCMATSALAEGPVVYSDLCLHRQEQELLGDRVTVVTEGNRISVKLEHASGELTAPVYGSGTTQGSVIAFTINDGRRQLTFSGTMTPEAIKGRFDQDRTDRRGSRNFLLKRMPATTAKVPFC